MDRYKPRAGTGLMAFEHIQYMQDSVQQALANSFADYIAVTNSFYVQGGEITEVPSGTGVIYTITDGVVCFDGEFMPLVGGTLLKSASQLVYLSIQDTGVDMYPVANVDGQVDHVMRERKAVMQVGVAYPSGSFSLGIQRKTTIDMLRLAGRVVPKGGILPYFGTMSYFDADTGAGGIGTPMQGWHVCNGLDDTVDLRGLVPFGATNVPNTGADPLYEGVATEVTNMGDVVGADKVTIGPNHLPAHKHAYSDSYRDHGPTGSGLETGTGLTAPVAQASGMTANNVTTNDLLDVRQAGRALVFIQSMV